jgi:hypothetical protein
MKLVKRFYLTEHLVYLVFWIMLFLIPIVGFWLGHDHFMGSSDMTPLYGALLLLFVYFVLFLINSLILLPRLFFQSHVWWYIFLVLVLCVLSVGIGQRIENYYHNMYKQDWGNHNREMMVVPEDHNAPVPPDINNSSFNRDGKVRKFHPMRPHPDIDMLFHYPDFNITLFILAIMVVSFNMAISLVFKALDKDIKNKTLAKEKVVSELEYLKYQINPHFLMNTLNNIHALVDINSEEAKMKLVKLSKLLRFVLYTGPKATVQLQEEISFLENYIDLMRIRYIDKVEISFSYPSVIPNLNIPTLLIIPFVENAFKHGVSYEKKSFIYVRIDCKDNRVLVNVKNSKAVGFMKDDRNCGIGVENTKRRLQLIYDNDYKLVIKDEEDIYNVELNIKAL